MTQINLVLLPVVNGFPCIFADMVTLLQSPALARRARPARLKVLPFLVLLAPALLALGGCGADPGGKPTGLANKRAPYSTVKGDSKPHPGVAAAKNFRIEGIDISKWQGDVDWRMAKEAGVHFAFIKSTEGGDHLDERFLSNWMEAKAAGVPRAAYHFVYWCRPATEQAAWFRANVPADPSALPPVLDVEWNAESRTCPARIPIEDARDKIRIMLRAMEAHTGKKPIIYTDITFHEDVLTGAGFDDYPFWVRSVAAEPEERYKERPWSFWQYTTTGLYPGVRGNVDRTVFAGTEAEWQKFLRENGTTTE